MLAERRILYDSLVRLSKVNNANDRVCSMAQTTEEIPSEDSSSRRPLLGMLLSIVQPPSSRLPNGTCLLVGVVQRARQSCIAET